MKLIRSYEEVMKKYVEKLRSIVFSLNLLALCVCVRVYVWRLHRINAVRREKEISSNRLDFVCFSSSVLPYSHSLYLAKRSSAVSLSFLSLSSAPPIFSLSPTSSARGQSLLSYRNLSCTSSIFLETISLGRGNRPNADAVRDRLSPPGTYLCYICNWKLYSADEINRSRRLFRNALTFRASTDSLRLSMIL